MWPFKRKVKDNTWIVYLDSMDDQEMSVRVDKKYTKAQYKHTFYVQIKYCEEKVTYLPDKEFLDKVAVIEDSIIEACEKTFKDNVVFLGTATFGGSCYLTFASNFDIKWIEYIKTMVDESLIAGIYPNDNMGYYNKVLYPVFVRKKIRR